MAESTHVELNLLLERESVAAGQPADTHLIVELIPRAEGVEHARPPLSVAFALDLSGSMHGPPLDHVKGSVEMLLDLLDPDDKVCVVGFSDDATEVAALSAVDGATKNLLKSRVRRLTSDGSTNMSAGLELAARLLGPRSVHERQLIILLTDGLPNRGISDEAGLADLVAGMRPDIVTVTMGYGPHHSEDLLSRMADAGSGFYFYIADPLESDDAFARAVGAQGDIVADAVTLVYRPGDGVEIAEFLTAVKPRFGPSGLVVDQPDLMMGRSRYTVARLALTPPAHTGPWSAVEVAVRYRVAGATDTRELAQTLDIPVTRELGELVNQAHMRVLLADAERIRAEARASADRDNFAGAAAMIRGLIERFERAPGFKPGDGSVLADALETLIDEKMAYERAPSPEEYRDFRRVNLGVDMQDGGWHYSDRKLASDKAQRIAQGAMGNLPQAYVEIVHNGQLDRRHYLSGDTTIGRINGNDIVLSSGSLSKRHTRLIGRNGKYVVVDLKSTNGTYVNGQKIGSPHVLQPGDKLYMGPFELHYNED